VPERRIAVVPEPAAAAERLNEALWVGAFEEEISRSQRSGAPLSLLLIELEDGDRMHAIEQPAVASATLGRFAQAVRDAVRRPDIIASESDTRAWVIARETGRPGAQALASRLGSAVREAEPWRGAPQTVSIGIGVLGEDGRDVDSLIEAAEESRFAAAASGVDVVRGPGDDDESRGENGAP
jgi:GGDEF domain-containing protein